jgi:hypothetical protein
MPVTLKAVDAELAKRGYDAMLVDGDGYYYFRGGEAGDWLDKTVRVPKLSSLTLEQWVQAFRDLKKKNGDIKRAGKRASGRRKRT